QEEINDIKAEVATKERAVPATLEERIAKIEKDTPKWIKNFKLKGDLRLRNDMENSDPGKDNNQQRIRFRVGATAKVNDKVDLGFGLATGANSITSTNQTIDGSFGTKEFDLDYAYIKYKPFDGITLTGGKFKTPFFHTDMLWDSDIRLEGFAGKLSHKVDFFDSTKLFLAGGYFPMEDTSTARDIALAAGQVGSEITFNEAGLKLKTGVAYYDFRSIEGATTATLTGEIGTNTYVGGALLNDYRVISPTAKLEIPKIGGILGEFASNTAVSSEDEAWRVGGWLGSSKVKKKGQWKLLGQYSKVEADSFVDIFPDGDFNDAGTNAKGWEAIFDYGLADNVIFSVDYYSTEVVTGTKSDDQKLQVDVIFKF
ncbi:MAG: putative porin, partial [Candidatus Omnitrophica bacterium]|nr:putative porin [Candidatus Omnitrophota bacterium]